MKRFLSLLAGFCTILPAFAGITYTCASSVPTTVTTSTGGSANLCDAINGSSVSGVYSGIFSNVNASIYIQFAGSGLGGSSVALNAVAYSSYLTALTADEGDANDVTAVNSLASTEPSLYSGDELGIPSALGAALGLSDSAGIDANGNSCTLGNSGCYNGVITIGASASPIYFPLSPSDPTGSGWDFFSLVEHETDEILGTFSCIGTGDGAAVDQCVGANSATYVSAADLFRYSSAGTLSFLNNANGGTAYFSIDGGQTATGYYNNSPNGEDYGDWSAGCGPPQVQNAEACQGVNMDLTNDGGAEIVVLDAIGYNLVTTPEPGTLGMIGASLTLLALFGIRRRTGGHTRDRNAESIKTQPE